MRADWDDAPKRVRDSDKFPRLISMLAAAAIGIGGAYWANQPAELPDEVTEQQAEPAPPTVTVTKRIEPEPAPQPTQERQTVFHDGNYTPRQPVNIMESRHIQHAIYQGQQPREVRTSSRGLNGSGQAVVHWEDARGRRSTWPTSYTYSRSQIDNNSLCSNYRRGSIEYRTCRKGAREWLQAQCDSDRHSTEARRMFCFAGSSFRP